MFRVNRMFFLVLPFALVLLSQGSQAAEGVDVKVVAEWPVDNPGVEKVLLRRVEFAPGATLDVTMEHFDFCNATQGEWAVTNHSTGVTTLYVVGSRWRMPPKGTEVTVTNPGNEPAVQWVYRLIEMGM